MMIVGLTGCIGAGKKTIAGRLWAAHGFETMSFMDPVWAALHAAQAIDRTLLHEPGYATHPLPQLGKSPLQLAYSLREWIDRSAPDLFLHVTQARMEALVERGERGIVLLDMRGDHEAAWLRSQGGRIWHVVRPRLCVMPTTQRVSAGNIDATLINDRGIEALHTHVDILVERLLDEVAA